MTKFIVVYVVMLVLFLGYVVRHPPARTTTCANLIAGWHPDVPKEIVEQCRKRRSM